MIDFALPNLQQTSCIDECHSTLSRNICAHELVCYEGWPVHLKHCNVTLPSSSLTFAGYGAPVRIENAYVSDYLVLLPCDGKAELLNRGGSFPVEGSAGVVIGPGSRFVVGGDARAQTIAWRIDARTVGRIASGRGRTFENGTVALGLERGAGSAFLRAFKFAMSELEYADGLGGSALLVRQLEDMLIASLLGAVDEQFGKEPISRAAPGCVIRVENYIAAHAGEDIEMPDLVTVSGVSARTLFRSFRLFRGVTPLGHLRNVRLERIRADLLSAGKNDSVTSILCRWGISQFGRFAADYRQVYGELPSDSLRMAQGSKLALQ